MLLDLIEKGYVTIREVCGVTHERENKMEGKLTGVVAVTLSCAACDG